MLPDIKVTCSFCRTDFVCQPDDLFGWEGDLAIYACPACHNAAEQSVQADGVCTCVEYINEPMTTALKCAFCGKPPRR